MRLLHMAVNGDIEIAVSQPIIEEVIRVLRDKFHWDGYRLQDARQQILWFARLVTPAETLDVVKEDEPEKPQAVLICCVVVGSLAPAASSLMVAGAIGRPRSPSVRLDHRVLVGILTSSP